MRPAEQLQDAFYELWELFNLTNRLSNIFCLDIDWEKIEKSGNYFSKNMIDFKILLM